MTLNGRPVEGATVVFLGKYRDDEPAHGVTDANGRYYLTTFFSSNDMPRGVVPERQYSVCIEKFAPYDGSVVCLKMASISAQGGNVKRYIREEAVYDLWPDGVPEDWPLDYVPMVTGIPRRLANDEEALTKITKLMRGIPLLPTKYADSSTSELSVYVERHGEPQVFNFDLKGEVEEIKRRPPRTGTPSVARLDGAALSAGF